MGENAQFLDSFHICILVDDEGKCYSLEHVAECLLAPGFPPTADGRHISSDSPPPPFRGSTQRKRLSQQVPRYSNHSNVFFRSLGNLFFVQNTDNSKICSPKFSINILERMLRSQLIFLKLDL